MALWRGWMDDPGDETDPAEPPPAGTPIPAEPDYAAHVRLGQARLKRRQPGYHAAARLWAIICKRWRETR